METLEIVVYGRNPVRTGESIRIASIFIACTIIGLIFPIHGYATQPDNDTLATSSHDSLTLEQCIETALKNSDRIAVAKGNLTKAGFNLKDARSGFLPELYLSGGYNLNDVYDRLEWNENHYNLSMSASMTPFTSGRTLLSVAKSKALLSSAEQGYRLTEIELILDVIRKYYDLLEASEILKLKKESLAQKRKHLEFANAQFDLGLVPKADILKAEVDVATAEVDSLQAEGDLTLVRAKLNDVIGVNLDYPTKIESVHFTREAPPNFDDCLNEALQTRSEITQQKANLSIKKCNVRLAQIDRLPTFTITGSYDVYADKFVFAGVPINRANWNDNTDWRVGIGLSFPIFDGGVRRRAIEAARIDLNEAELNYADLEKAITLEAKLAYLNLVTTFKKIDLTQKQVDSGEESYNVALGRYKTGVAPITEVIDAGVVFSNSRANHTKAIYDYLLAKAVLKKTMGQLPY